MISTYQSSLDVYKLNLEHLPITFIIITTQVINLSAIGHVIAIVTIFDIFIIIIIIIFTIMITITIIIMKYIRKYIDGWVCEV